MGQLLFFFNYHSNPDKNQIQKAGQHLAGRP